MGREQAIPEGGSRVPVWPWAAWAQGRGNPPRAWSEGSCLPRLETPWGRAEPQGPSASEQKARRQQGSVENLEVKVGSDPC